MKKIYFIGIVASAIAPLAILMKEKGFKVEGSDENVYDPARSLLNNAGVKWYEGYDPKRVEDADLVILGGAPLIKDPNNPEYLRAKELGKQIEGYAYLIQKYLLKETSIVVAGTYGKTTTSALLNWILTKAKLDPSYMIGGKPIDFPNGVHEGEGKISCMEGDEFFSVYGYDEEPRFIYYKPTHTLISASKWDHTNIYPTEGSYVLAYKKLVDETAKNEGILVLCASGDNNDKVEIHATGKIPLVTYMVEGHEQITSLDPQYVAKKIFFKNGITYFNVHKEGDLLAKFRTKMLGKHNVENCLAAISMADILKIDVNIISESVETFNGIKRRLEVLGRNNAGALVIDDFAHSPIKAKASLNALKTSFPEKKVISVYAPRMSTRENREELKFYDGAFDQADQVYIPKISVKKSTPKDQRIYGKDIVEAISSSQKNVLYIPQKEELKNLLISVSDKDTIIVFMSAGGWGGLMDEVVNS